MEKEIKKLQLETELELRRSQAQTSENYFEKKNEKMKKFVLLHIYPIHAI